MIIEETGDVCSFNEGSYEDMTFNDYKKIRKNLNKDYLKKTSLLYRINGSEIVDLINYVFAEYESCIVCKCKIESIDGKLYYTIYGRAWQDWDSVWDSMTQFAKRENKKRYRIARRLKKLESTDVDLKIIFKGDVVKKPTMGRYGFIKQNDYFDFHEESVFKIIFAYDDMYQWIKATAEEYLGIAKTNLEDYYENEGLHFDEED